MNLRRQPNETEKIISNTHTPLLNQYNSIDLLSLKFLPDPSLLSGRSKEEISEKLNIQANDSQHEREAKIQLLAALVTFKYYRQSSAHDQEQEFILAFIKQITTQTPSLNLSLFDLMTYAKNDGIFIKRKLPTHLKNSLQAVLNSPENSQNLNSYLHNICKNDSSHQQKIMKYFKDNVGELNSAQKTEKIDISISSPKPNNSNFFAESVNSKIEEEVKAARQSLERMKEYLILDSCWRYRGKPSHVEEFLNWRSSYLIKHSSTEMSSAIETELVSVLRNTSLQFKHDLRNKNKVLFKRYDGCTKETYVVILENNFDQEITKMLRENQDLRSALIKHADNELITAWNKRSNKLGI